MPTRIERTDTVATVFLDEPRGNALGTATLRALAKLLDDLERTAPHAVVLTGRDKVFGVGLDLVEANALPPADLERYVARFEEFFLRLFTFPIPLIAAINGHALAGGAVMALACDHRVVKDGPVTLALNEVELGMPFPSAAFEVARFGLPPRTHTEALAFGRRYDADSAVAAGFAHEKHADPLVRAQEVAAQIALLGRSAVAAVRADLRREHVARAKENAAHTQRLFVDAWLSDSVQPRIRAVVEGLKKRG